MFKKKTWYMFCIFPFARTLAQTFPKTAASPHPPSPPGTGDRLARGPLFYLSRLIYCHLMKQERAGLEGTDDLDCHIFIVSLHILRDYCVCHDLLGQPQTIGFNCSIFC